MVLIVLCGSGSMAKCVGPGLAAPVMAAAAMPHGTGKSSLAAAIIAEHAFRRDLVEIDTGNFPTVLTQEWVSAGLADILMKSDVFDNRTQATDLNTKHKDFIDNAPNTQHRINNANGRRRVDGIAPRYPPHTSGTGFEGKRDVFFSHGHAY